MSASTDPLPRGTRTSIAKCLALCAKTAFLLGWRLMRSYTALRKKATAATRGPLKTPVALPCLLRGVQTLRRNLTRADRLNQGLQQEVAVRMSELERTVAALHESEAPFRAMADAAPVLIWETDESGMIFFNGHYLDFFGGGLDEVHTMGWAGFLHPDDARGYLAAYCEAFNQRRPYAYECRFRRADGQYRWLRSTGRPVGDKRFVGCSLDVTDSQEAQLALRASEAQLRDLVATLDLGTAMARGWDGPIRFWSEGCAHLYGWTAEEAVGQDAHTLLRTDFPIPRTEIEAVLEREGEWAGDLRQRTHDGREVVVATRKVLRHDAHGEPETVLETLADVTAQRAAEAALRAETETLETLNRIDAAIAAELDLERLVQKVTDAGAALTGAAFGAFFYDVADADGAAYSLYAVSGAPREAFADLPMPRGTAAFVPTLGGVGVLRSDDITADPRYGHNPPYRGMPTGHLPVRSYLTVPVVSRSGGALGGLFFGHPEPGVFTERAERLLVGIAAQAVTAIDYARLYRLAQQEVEERRQTEAARQLLMQEVDHRAKNALAVVQAAVRLTRAPDLPSYVKSLEGRVSALARAQTLLANDRWAGADLRALVQGELAPFAATCRSIALAGPRVALPAEAAQPLAVALHELATNAVKHGALSVQDGQVTVSWQIEGGSGGRLRLRWTEKGGPPVAAPPERQGFGSRVLDSTVRLQLGGHLFFAWQPAGLVCDIEVPLAPRVAIGDAEIQ